MVVGENASGSGGHGCSGSRRSRHNKRQSCQGQTSQTANQTQINGQPGQGYMVDGQQSPGQLGADQAGARPLPLQLFREVPCSSGLRLRDLWPERLHHQPPLHAHGHQKRGSTKTSWLTRGVWIGTWSWPSGIWIKMNLFSKP